MVVHNPLFMSNLIHNWYFTFSADEPDSHDPLPPAPPTNNAQGQLPDQQQQQPVPPVQASEGQDQTTTNQPLTKRLEEGETETVIQPIPGQTREDGKLQVVEITRVGGRARKTKKAGGVGY